MSLFKEAGGAHSQDSFEYFLSTNSFVSRAYKVAEIAHGAKNQKRKDGTSYITHPVAVTKIMHDEWGVKDPEILAGGLLHDTTEDTELTLNDIEKEFGTTVRNYVYAVEKFRSEKKEDQDNETIKKILGINFFDPRPILIKLADRLHNMRTMQFVEEIKRLPKAWETLNIYRSLAESLGLWKVKTELEDLSLKYIDPKIYAEISEKIKNDFRMNPRFRSQIINHLGSILAANNVRGEVQERINSATRIMEKLDRQELSKINDLVSFRVVLENLSDIYKVFGLIRNEYKAFEDESQLDDFIAHPRENNYRAIQLTINTPKIGAIEIAVTTKEFEDFNNFGVASLLKRGQKDLSKYALKLVITPKGSAKFIHPKATGVDIAYLIDPDYGLIEKGILVDGRLKDITDIVPNGAHIDIQIGQERKHPDPKLAKSAYLERTKRLIEEQNSKWERKEVEEIGKKMVESEVSKRGIIDINDLLDEEAFPFYSRGFKKILYRMGCHEPLVESLYFQVGSQKGRIEKLAAFLNEEGFTKEKLRLTSVLIEGGRDEPGILNKFTDVINSLGGNIKINHGVGREGGSFRQKFVIEQPKNDPGFDSKLLKIFKENKKIRRLIIS